MGSLTANEVAEYFGVTTRELFNWIVDSAFPRPLMTPEGCVYREADINVWMFWIFQRLGLRERGATDQEIDDLLPPPKYSELLYIDPLDPVWARANSQQPAKS